MKKYKLLKDLLHLKAGEVRKTSEWINLYPIPNHLSFYPEWFEEVEEVPEWVICIKSDRYSFTKNKLYECTGIDYFTTHSQYLVKKDDKGSTGNGHTKGKYLQEATKAEVEAHKLNFHIGDKVKWTENYPSTGIIQSFHHDGSFVCADLGDVKHDSCALEYLEHYKEELEIDKWYNYNQCTICYQGLKDNILQGYGFVHNEWHTVTNLGTNPERWELADMEEVQELLLKEAKKRYPIGTKIKDKGSDIIYTTTYRNTFCGGENKPHFPSITIQAITCGALNDTNDFQDCLLYKEGEWTEIVKEESRLMLGDREIEVGKKKFVRTVVPVKAVWFKDRTAEEFITIEVCRKWYKEVKKLRKQYIDKNDFSGNITKKLGSYDVKIPIIRGEKCKIGCIGNVTWKQIKAVNKAIKEL